MDRILSSIKPSQQGPAIANLQESLLFIVERRQLTPNNLSLTQWQQDLTDEMATQSFGERTEHLFSSVIADLHFPAAEFVNETVAGRLNSLLEELGAFRTPAAPVVAPASPVPAAASPLEPTVACTVEGKIVSRSRAGVGRLLVEIVDKNVCGEDVSVSQTVAGDDGTYRFTFTIMDLHQRGKEKPDLQACAFAGENLAGEKPLGCSEIRYNATNCETGLDIFLTDEASKSLPSEYDTLTGALSANFKGSLGGLKETDECQDITYLSNKTGWDARAVALAALADQFSARTADRSGAPAIPQAFFYALFRAGLPANEDALYHTDARTLEGVWKQAAEQGVIPKASADQIPDLVKRFQVLSAEKLLTGPALVGASSLKEMLTISRLNDAQQTVFAQLFAANRSDPPAFWKAIGDAFGQDTASRLQVDGKLGFLTINNASLMEKVHTAAGRNGLSDPLQLAQTGYYRVEAWNQLLTKDIPIPNEIPGDTLEARRASYASYLAAQVRLSYPTAAVAQMVKSGELPLTGAEKGASDQVYAFLTEHQGKFEIGVLPVQQYIARNNLQVAEETVRQVKRLQRVYQITPGDEAMNGLMKRGVDAAYHIVRYDKDTFVQSFAADMGGADQAALTYDKSVQVHNAVLNIALGYLTARSAPAIGVHSPPSVLDPVPANTGDVIAYATLESLFGSMDFCACEHCRSILSPAAYLVDLLLFLQSDPGVWNDFLTTWKQSHANAPYPFADQIARQNFLSDWNSQHPGQPLPNTEVSPFDVLVSRRPDLQHLALSCENTNTALPYIDVVNETLEYYVANGTQKFSLEGYLGYDTNGVASEDLLASPQFVVESAYTTLLDERFPGPLPFHRPLERLRRYFHKFEVPLPLAMERLRKTDDLERGANPYGWRDILMEEISLSRAEYEVLTDSTAVPLWQMYGFQAGTADADVTAGLANAKQLTRRVGITYDELVAILTTRFFNPNGNLVPKLERLGVPFATLKALKDGTITDAAFDALLPTGTLAPNPAEYGGDIKAWVRQQDNNDRIMGIITLTDPALGPDSCSFDNLEFRYSKPMADVNDTSTRLGAVEFLRLARFIRLWKKLGWTIEQTDSAICALYRADLMPLDASDIDAVTKLDAGFLTLLPRLGIVMRVIRELNLGVKRDLLPLLACWSEIGTRGDTALYRQMFLNPALLAQDTVFADDGYGEFLRDTAEKLAEHAEALRSAFNLTGDEYERIVAALGYDTNTPLTISNASAIYRHGWLARKLKLSVSEFLLLIQLTGLDPFAAPELTNPAILQLISLVHSLRDRSLKSVAALYLIWNQDLSGKSAPDLAQVAAFARTLRLGLAAVENEFAVSDDPDGAIAQSRMATVYGSDAATFFFGLLNDTLIVETDFNDPDATLASDAGRQAIENAAGNTDAGAPKIAYDDFRKRLSYSGLLTSTTRDAIKLAAGAGAATFGTAVDNLYDKNQAVITPFFARYPELQSPYDTYVSDFSHSALEKRALVLNAILPELVERRKRQQALQAVSAAVNADPALTQSFLDPTGPPFALHAAGHSDRPALNDLLALETSGLAVQFFASDTATGTLIPSPDIASNLNYAPAVGATGNPLPANPVPDAAISGVWRGYLEGPESGFFNLRIETDAAATVTLLLDDKPVILTQNGASWNNTDPLELRAGSLYLIGLTIEKVHDVVRVQWDWQPQGQGRSTIPARYLYPAAPFEAFKETYVRFLKVASLATDLGLTANEMSFFATRSDYQIAGDGWLSALAVNGDPAPGVASALLEPLLALLEFARIKAEISPDDESLLAILRDPTSATQNTESLLYSITRWNQASLNDVLGQLGDNVGGLTHFELFRRVYDAFALIQKMGLAANALIEATTNEPTADTVGGLQAALRARYDAADWRDVIRPINDEMRGLQRDALVAYILHQMRSHPESAHIDTPDKLFEYFLMDVQMDSCMETSRIRHALSSVQLFIERCLMNLEPRVSPAAINAKQWEWMKRYRVWEANRKVYLFPENWLEPELRTDKSPFFKEIESELLQSDITEESAGAALLNYLSKLEEVAKLEPCGIFHAPADLAKRTGEVNHVIARTAGAHRKYYYRRYEYGYWTPWEQIKLDIEDNPVIPVVWNDRLFLFWLRILKQGPDTVQTPFNTNGSLAELNTSNIKTNPPNISVSSVLSWSEYFNGKWQSTRTSDIARPLKLFEFPPNAFDRSQLKLSALFWPQNALRIIVSYASDFGASFFLHNAHSSPELRPQKKETHFSAKRSFEIETDDFKVNYPESNVSNVVLVNSISDRVVQPNHPVAGDPWDAPFFYEDARHVFYVTTLEELVWIPQWQGFGIQATTPQATDSIPVLVFAPAKAVPDPVGPIIRQTGFGTINRSPSERYVTEDAYIHRAIGTSGTVRYDGTEIGLAGSQIKSVRTK